MDNRVPSREYVRDPSFVMQKYFLPEVVYEQTLRACVICCTDILFVSRVRRTAILLPRKVHPFRGWWLCGGRIPAGTPMLQAAVQKVRQETRLTITEDRLELIAVHRYLFPLREQHPQSCGSDSMAWTYALDLTDAECGALLTSLDPKEYEASLGMREFNRVDMVRNNLYQEIIDLYDTVFPA